MIRHRALREAAILTEVPFDKTITQDRLNIETKVRSNLFPWNGQFSPQLVHTFLEAYSRPQDLVLDPFLGSGTVLVEAGRFGAKAFGSEINPAAFQMARIYKFINMEIGERSRILSTLDRRLQVSFGERSLFSPRDQLASEVETKRRVLDLWSTEQNRESKSLLGALVVLLDFFKEGPSNDKVLSKWSKLRNLVEQLPYSQAEIGVANTDARLLPLQAASVDLVISSPPYINVFNYHQQYRASAEALGWDLLHVARSEIGSNRKNRGNRFLTVIQYCLDIAEALKELRRVCRPSARIILVVGRESNVLKTRFFNGEIVTQLGVKCVGFKAEKRQERVFQNRFGSAIYEDIIHFHPNKSDDRFVGVPPVDIARQALQSALEYAPQESHAGLKDALTNLHNVKPSTLYESRQIERSIE